MIDHTKKTVTIGLGFTRPTGVPKWPNTAREMAKHGHTLGNTRVPQGAGWCRVEIEMLRGGGDF